MKTFLLNRSIFEVISIIQEFEYKPTFEEWILYKELYFYKYKSEYIFINIFIIINMESTDF